MIHKLKISTEYLNDIIRFEKTFEVRNNDRNFKVGDYLSLEEYGKDDEYTGRFILVKVTYILKDKSFCKDEYVVMSIIPCRIQSTDGIDDMIYAREGLPVYGQKEEGEL